MAEDKSNASDIEYMDKLNKLYEAVDILNSLEIPVSIEQTKTINMMERQYLKEEVIPRLTKEIGPIVDEMHNKFRLSVSYSHAAGLDIRVVENKPIQESVFTTTDNQPKRQRKYILRVIFPDNHVSCSKMVWETLVDVVRYAGAKRVQALNIYIMGDNLVSSELNANERYRVGQKEVEPGLYVCTYSSTDTKYEQIRKINRDLDLGIKIEKVML